MWSLGKPFSRSCGCSIQCVLCFNYLCRPFGWICDSFVLILDRSLLSSHAIVRFRAAISKEPASLYLTFLSHSVTEPIMIKPKARFFSKALLSSRNSLCGAKSRVWYQQAHCWAVHLSPVVKFPEGEGNCKWLELARAPTRTAQWHNVSVCMGMDLSQPGLKNNPKP